jgi:hypothetical protein
LNVLFAVHSEFARHAPPLALGRATSISATEKKKQTQALSLTSVALQIRLSHPHGKK